MPLKTAYNEVKEGKALLIDVREEAELVESGMAEGAIFMPMSKMDGSDPSWKTFKAGLPKDKTIYIYCKAGGRSGRVVAMLGMEGFRTENIGGFHEWQSAGLPTKKYP